MSAVGSVSVESSNRQVRQLDVQDAKVLLQEIGIEMLPSRVVTSADEVAAAVSALETPVVMKIVSPDVVHKTDVGGVALGIDSPTKAQAAFEQMVETVRSHLPNARIKGVMVEEMFKADWELVVGAIADPVFGPVVMFGAGGVSVEIFRDVAFRVAPVSNSEALAMIAQCQIGKALRGFRGKSPVDQDRLARVIAALSEFAWQRRAEILEMEINPILVSGSRIVAADARVIASSVFGGA